MQRHVTPNTCHATCGQFAEATRDFLRGKVLKNWEAFVDFVTDHSRVISPRDFRAKTRRRSKTKDTLNPVQSAKLADVIGTSVVGLHRASGHVRTNRPDISVDIR